MITITHGNITAPDSYGDSSAEVSFSYSNEGSDTQERLITLLTLFNRDGLILRSSRDEHEEHLETGETWESELGSGYLPTSLLSIRDNRVALEVQGCTCSYRNLGSFDVAAAAISGSGQPVDLGGGLVVQGLSIRAGKPDDDGDVSVELNVLVRNGSATYIPRASLQARLLGANGRELEDCSSYGDALLTGEMKMLSGSCYLKKNRLNGAQMEVSLSIFRVVQSEKKDHTSLHKR